MTRIPNPFTFQPSPPFPLGVTYVAVVLRDEGPSSGDVVWSKELHGVSKTHALQVAEKKSDEFWEKSGRKRFYRYRVDEVKVSR